MNAGVHTIPASLYHDDPCEAPSLSASIAHILCSQSPAHARAQHPRLNPAYVREEEQKFDRGQAAHALFLEGRDAVQVINADSWRTKSSQEERDEARALGKIPLLTAQWDETQAMCVAVKEQLAAHEAEPPLFTVGQPEQTLVWEEPDGVVCRARLDWVRTDCCAIDDLKTTSRSANPEAYSRALFNVGGDVQAAFYLRGLLAVTGSMRAPDFRWCVVETSPPYALSVISPAPEVLELGNRKVLHALKVWRECLASGEWPGYPTRVCYANAPAWEETRWLERQAIEEAA